MNTLGKRLLPVLLAMLLAGSLLRGSARAAGSTEEMVAHAKRGVVQLYTLGFQNGELTNACSGTGFAVGAAGEDSDVFVTNWHVVTASGKLNPAQARVYIALENAALEDAVHETDRVIPCEILYITPGNPDMAILRAAEPVSGFKALPLLSADQIMDAAHVVALGYPGVLDDFSATNGGVDDMSVTQGYIVRHAVGTQEDADLAGTRLLFFDAVISSGNSGGPLLNDAGAVVGINTYGFGREATTDYAGAIYIDYAMEALDGLGISYDVYQPPPAEGPQERGGLSPLAVALIAAGVVIAALSAVLVFMVLRRPDRASAAVGAPDAPAAVGGPDAPAAVGDPSAPTAVGAPNVPGAAAGADRRQELGTGLALLGPGGRSTPIPVSGLVIGRDPTLCTLSLPAETKGVSRRHCQVAAAGGSLLLTDLGSSYGTFIAGQRLEPNCPAPLSKGSSFYLGGAANTFTVR